MLFALAALAHADAVLLEVGGMSDDCCAAKVASALEALDFVDRAGASPKEGIACATLTGPADEAAMRAALVARGYTLASAKPVAECPASTRPSTDPWADAAGLDVKVVSHGERVDLAAVRAPDKVTIVDFGAPWCGPCHTSAAALQAWMKGRDDVAIRAVVLDGADPKASFAQPVAAQHLQWAEGVPYFVVLSAEGKPIYKGSDVQAVMSAVEKRAKKK